ncbi:MAG: hypothetical protein U1D55_07685 [Phycisphaerae bacterium]
MTIRWMCWSIVLAGLGGVVLFGYRISGLTPDETIKSVESSWEAATDEQWNTSLLWESLLEKAWADAERPKGSGFYPVLDDWGVVPVNANLSSAPSRETISAAINTLTSHSTPPSSSSILNLGLSPLPGASTRALCEGAAESARNGDLVEASRRLEVALRVIRTLYGGSVRRLRHARRYEKWVLETAGSVHLSRSDQAVPVIGALDALLSPHDTWATAIAGEIRSLRQMLQISSCGELLVPSFEVDAHNWGFEAWCVAKVSQRSGLWNVAAPLLHRTSHVAAKIDELERDLVAAIDAPDPVAALRALCATRRFSALDGAWFGRFGDPPDWYLVKPLQELLDVTALRAKVRARLAEACAQP